MIVLAIDTCGPTGSVALGNLEGETVSLLAQSELAGKTYSSQIVPAVRSLLAGQGLDASAVEAILVVNGPGSFTGVRIGVSSAKGFAEALRIPLLAVSRLAVLASKAGAECAALDAGRGEFYFRDGSQEALVASSDLPLLAARPVAICEPSTQRVFPDAILVDAPTAGDALKFAAPRFLTGDFADVVVLDGNYLRRSDAEIFAKTVGKA